MLETYFSAVKILEHLRKGPSGPYMDSSAASLERSGYRPATAVRYLRAAAPSDDFLEPELDDEEPVADDDHPVVSQPADWTIASLRERWESNRLDLQPQFQREYVCA